MKHPQRLILLFSFAATAAFADDNSAQNICSVKPDPDSQRLDAYAEKRELIANNLLLSFFSSIAYEERGLGRFAIPSQWKRRDTSIVDANTGLFAAVFLNESDKEVVVAVRGTEFWSLKDWTQNFFPSFGGQADIARTEIEKVMDEYDGWWPTLCN